MSRLIPLSRLLVLGCLAPGPLALAHAPDLIAVSVERLANGEVEERLVLTPDTLLRLAPLDGDGDGRVAEEELRAGSAAVEAGLWDDMPLSAGGRACVRTESGGAVQPATVALWARFACVEGPLTQRFRLLSALPAGHHVLVGLADQPPQHLSGDRQTAVLAPRAGGSGPEPGTEVPFPEAGEASGFSAWVRLGLVHILEGFDHLAFVAALLLAGGGWRRVLAAVTLFTVAHSLTLGATVLGWVVIGPHLGHAIELAIALSIAVMAAQNLRGGVPRNRGLLILGCGLLHGFGFAGALGSYPLGTSVGMALAGFNLGVELGQAAVVLLLLPLVHWLSRRAPKGRVVLQGASWVLLGLGVVWTVERAIPGAVLWAVAPG